MLDFHAWLEAYAATHGPLDQQQYSLAQEAFYFAHPGKGPQSSLMQAAQALPPLPNTWHRRDSDRTTKAVTFYPGNHMDGCPILATEEGVIVDDIGFVSVADLITVLQHADAAHRRLRKKED